MGTDDEGLIAMAVSYDSVKYQPDKVKRERTMANLPRTRLKYDI